MLCTAWRIGALRQLNGHPAGFTYCALYLRVAWIHHPPTEQCSPCWGDIRSRLLWIHIQYVKQGYFGNNQSQTRVGHIPQTHEACTVLLHLHFRLWKTMVTISTLHMQYRTQTKHALGTDYISEIVCVSGHLLCTVYYSSVASKVPFMCTESSLYMIRCGLIFEHNCTISMNKNSVIQVPANSPGKYQALQISSFAYHVPYRVLVTNSGHILLNNWARIKLACGIMSCGTNDFNTPFLCSVVWFCSFKCWKKAVMNIYGSPPVCFTKFWW